MKSIIIAKINAPTAVQISMVLASPHLSDFEAARLDITPTITKPTMPKIAEIMAPILNLNTY